VIEKAKGISLQAKTSLDYYTGTDQQPYLFTRRLEAVSATSGKQLNRVRVV
jgi:hypothetical protein